MPRSPGRRSRRWPVAHRCRILAGHQHGRAARGARSAATSPSAPGSVVARRAPGLTASPSAPARMVRIHDGAAWVRPTGDGQDVPATGPGTQPLPSSPGGAQRGMPLAEVKSVSDVAHRPAGRLRLAVGLELEVAQPGGVGAAVGDDHPVEPLERRHAPWVRRVRHRDGDDVRGHLLHDVGGPVDDVGSLDQLRRVVGTPAAMSLRATRRRRRRRRSPWPRRPRRAIAVVVDRGLGDQEHGPRSAANRADDDQHPAHPAMRRGGVRAARRRRSAASRSPSRGRHDLAGCGR